MTSVRMLGVGVLGSLAALIALSCATPGSEGTDSNTHWLDQCQTDRDCGTLSCRCGKCTKPCSGASDCASLGATASCAVPAACPAEKPVCVAPCTTTADCPKGDRALVCEGGQCTPAVTDGGSSATDGICPDTVAPDGPCSFNGDCTTSCAGGARFYTSWSCTKGRWVGTLGLMDCPDGGVVDGGDDGNGASCPPGTTGGDACSLETARCWTACVQGPSGGVRGQLVCSGGQWVAGKGLFSCGPDSGMVADAAVDAGKDPCAPMDAVGGYACGGPGAIKWDGTRCVPVVAKYFGLDASCCIGADCHALYATVDECVAAHSACFSTACKTGAECALTDRTCSPPRCLPFMSPNMSDVVSLNASSVAAWRDSVGCIGPGDCSGENSKIQALCRAGQCTSVDVAPYAPCLKDDDCILIGKDCCACAGLTDPNSVVAINGSMSGQYVAGTCGTTAKCGVCTNPPEHPPGLAAKCNTTGGYCYAAPTP